MSNHTVLVTGANGQLGTELMLSLKKNGYHAVGAGREELNITDFERVQQRVCELKPGVIIHASAYTKVDLAESEPDEAYKVYAVGTAHVAIASKLNNAKLFYISTDYVFDGLGQEPYQESSITNPLSVYGASKLAGEQIVRSLLKDYFIIRTSWVYGMAGHNFVKTMLRLASERDFVSVVNDQIGSPTYTFDLAQCILRLIPTDYYGTYHISNSGSCTWYDFAVAIYEEMGIPIPVLPISTEQFPRPAKRPAYSVMEHSEWRQKGFHEVREWRSALKAFLREWQESNHSHS